MLMISWSRYTHWSRSVRRLLFADDEFSFLRNYEILIIIVILPNPLTEQKADLGRVKWSMASDGNMLTSFVRSKSGMFV